MEDATDTTDTIRYPRTVTATDTEWRRIKERAKAAGMPVSRYVCERAMGPDRLAGKDVSPAAVTTTLERIETAVLVLAEVERQRLAEGDGWEAAARRVALRLRSERPVAGDGAGGVQ